MAIEINDINLITNMCKIDNFHTIYFIIHIATEINQPLSQYIKFYIYFMHC